MTKGAGAAAGVAEGAAAGVTVGGAAGAAAGARGVCRHFVISHRDDATLTLRYLTLRNFFFDM